MIKICLCDDDMFWLEMMEIRIKKCIEQFDCDYVFTSCKNLEELKKALDSQCFDVLFLDIVLGDINSADWLAENLNRRIPEVIFMTAYPEEAYSISEVDHAYFLVKPRITDEMISKALKRAQDRIDERNGEAGIFRYGGKSETVKYSDILYFESNNNYVRIHLKDKTVLDIRKTIKECSKDLPRYFLRCHRSYAVNMDFIKQYTYSRFIMEDLSEIQIPPKKYAETVDEYIKYIKNRRKISEE